MKFLKPLSMAILCPAWLLTTCPVQAAAVIDAAATNQTITGFGGMNFPRWIADLTTAQANTAFGTGTGQLGLSLLRISCAPVQADWSKEVPTAKIAVANGAAVFATPWSPPASMKSNNSTVGGTLNTGSYADYATYLESFVTSMKTNGIDLYGISVQNEPDITVTYESCSWSPAQMLNFVKNNAGAISTKVIASESYHFDKSYTDPILNDAAAAANVDVVATHLYGASPSTYPLAARMGKELWMTEHYISSTTSANSWPDALGIGKEIMTCMNDGFNAYTWWYIRRSYGLLTEDGLVSKQGYVMSHFSKFVRPGFVRVDLSGSLGSGVTGSAYRKGTSLVVVLINSNSSASSPSFTLSGATVPAFTKYTTSGSKSVGNDGSVVVNGGAFTTSLDAQSITTLVYNGTDAIRDPARQVPSSRMAKGAYEIFDLRGTPVGMANVSQGNSLRSAIRDLTARTGTFIAKPGLGAIGPEVEVVLP